MNPTVSVNLCCYNSEKYLEETLQSVFTQTFKDWELVIVNDGSIDTTDQIIQKHIAAGRRIVYHPQPNAGLAPSRNQALRLSSGKYIVFLDHDDVLLERALETQVSHLEASGCAMAYGGLIYIDEKGRELRRRIPKARCGDLLAAQLRQFEINVPAVMIRRTALVESELVFDPVLHMAEDYCLFMQLAAGYSTEALPQALARYRVHPNALTKKTIARWGVEVDYTLDLLISRNPRLLVKYKKAFREARARAAYYRARNHVVKRERLGAIQAIAPYLLCDFRYPFLFLLLLLPLRLWDKVHEWYTGRSFRG